MHTLEPPIEKYQKAQERDRIIGQKQKHGSNPARNLSQDHPGTSGANRELTGYSMQQLMVHEERVEFYKKCAFYGVIAFFIGGAIGGVGMEYLFS